MKKLFGIFKYEYYMSIKRTGLLIIGLLFTAFYIYLWNSVSDDANVDYMITRMLFNEAGQTVFFLNLFFPVIAGIASADRGIRDLKIGVREIIKATQISNAQYVIGKYLGVVFSFITIELGMMFIVSFVMVIFYHLSPLYIVFCLIAVLVISAPALFFVIAFSLACPYIMPIRVYQILFTGYWYWGNYINPDYIPSVSNTLLNACGKYALSAFFDIQTALDVPEVLPSEALANIAILLLVAGLTITSLIIYLNQEGKRE